MISEKEARLTVLQLGTAIINDDKEVRELIYADLDNDSLKRIIRWAIRQMVYNFSLLAATQGHNPLEAWKQMSLALNHALDQEYGEDDDHSPE